MPNRFAPELLTQTGEDVGGEVLGRRSADLVHVELDPGEVLPHEWPLRLDGQKVRNTLPRAEPDLGLAGGFRRRGLGPALRLGPGRLTAIGGFAGAKVLEQRLEPFQYVR